MPLPKPIPIDLVLLKIFHAQKNHIRPFLHELGVTPGQPKVLHYLERHDNAQQREIAVACDIDTATISQLLDAMAAAELITRSADAEDRRVARIALTAKGKSLQEELTRRFDLYNDKLLHDFTAGERAQLEAYLHRLYHNLTGNDIEF